MSDNESPSKRKRPIKAVPDTEPITITTSAPVQQEPETPVHEEVTWDQMVGTVQQLVKTVATQQRQMAALVKMFENHTHTFDLT